jgi:hypothetical protein
MANSPLVATGNRAAPPWLHNIQLYGFDQMQGLLLPNMHVVFPGQSTLFAIISLRAQYVNDVLSELQWNPYPRILEQTLSSSATISTSVQTPSVHLLLCQSKPIPSGQLLSVKLQSDSERL